MAAYLGSKGKRREIERVLKLMKQWAREGK